MNKIKRIKKIMVFLSVFFLSFSICASAEVPNKTVVIGNRAYDLEYANNVENLKEIKAQLGEKGKVFIKVRNRWFSNDGNEINKDFIPKVIYKNELGKISIVNENDGEKNAVNVLRVSYLKNNKLEIVLDTNIKEWDLKEGIISINNKIIERENISIGEEGIKILVDYILQNQEDIEVSINGIIDSTHKKVTILKEVQLENKSLTGALSYIKDEGLLKDLKINGDLYINANKVSLENSTVSGYIYLNPGADGDAYLKNVTADGVIVLSGGENSIHISDSKIKYVEIESKERPRVKLEGDTKIEETKVSSPVILEAEEGSFGKVEIDIKKEIEKNNDEDESQKSEDKSEVKTKEEQEIVLKGNFEEIVVEKAEKINLEKGKIENIVFEDEVEVNISEDAEIDTLVTNGNEIEIVGEGKENIKEKKEKKDDQEDEDNEDDNSGGVVIPPVIPPPIVGDKTKPVIALEGQAIVTIYVGEVYEDDGATAYDNKDGDITSRIQVTSDVDVNRVGEYLIKYNVSDNAGNKAEEVIRKVIVKEGNLVYVECEGDIKVGQEFYVYLKAEKIIDVYGLQVDLDLNKDIVEIEEISLENGIDENKEVFIDMNAEDGKVVLAALNIGDASGSNLIGEIIKIRLKAINEGTIILNHENIKVKLINNNVEKIENKFLGLELVIHP